MFTPKVLTIQTDVRVWVACDSKVQKRCQDHNSEDRLRKTVQENHKSFPRRSWQFLNMQDNGKSLKIQVNFYFYSINVITFIAVQWSSQPSFTSFLSQTLSSCFHPATCLLWKSYVFQSLWVSICSAKRFISIIFFFLDSTCKWWNMSLVSQCLTSLGMVISSSIHVATNDASEFVGSLWANHK